MAKEKKDVERRGENIGILVNGLLKEHTLEKQLSSCWSLHSGKKSECEILPVVVIRHLCCFYNDTSLL